MGEFFIGFLAAIGILGGLCAFNYWMFVMMEDRLDVKLTNISGDLHAVADDLKDERKSKTQLYSFVLENCIPDKPKKEKK